MSQVSSCDYALNHGNGDQIFFQILDMKLNESTYTFNYYFFPAIFNILHNCKCQKSYLFLHYLVSDEGDDISH